MTARSTLICTVGTSLFYPNLTGLKPDEPDPTRAAVAAAFARRDASQIARALGAIPASDRLCGAEINSIAALQQRDLITANANLFFCHSDTADGLLIGAILKKRFELAGHPLAETRPIADLQDADPQRFKTRGLRNLAKEICKVIRSHGAPYSAINATGGYKAQIAIAVLMGQALDVPVYYKHERFDDIISFPPMPVSLDFDFWLATNDLLFDLSQSNEPVRLDEYRHRWNDRLETLVERVTIDGCEYIELSPTGQIFHDTFRERFRNLRGSTLPPPAPPERTRFRRSSHGIEAIFSDGSFTAKLDVKSTARTESEMDALVAALNDWLAT